ncbi:MAG: hypothetical protein Ct9H90mP16_09200 [Candidatus Poseidoniales archaeon]|nr:MAG: hypothetical protein Ct9H90mP16_09200 [Candidatus Poseidoniales archaeon]
MVRTRPDVATVEAQEVNYTRFELAMLTGANFITTDFPGNDLEVEYAIWLPQGPVMCNPQTAPSHCTTRANDHGEITPQSQFPKGCLHGRVRVTTARARCQVRPQSMKMHSKVGTACWMPSTR